MELKTEFLFVSRETQFMPSYMKKESSYKYKFTIFLCSIEIKQTINGRSESIEFKLLFTYICLTHSE